MWKLTLTPPNKNNAALEQKSSGRLYLIRSECIIFPKKPTLTAEIKANYVENGHAPSSCQTIVTSQWSDHRMVNMSNLDR